jgi:hypothetical protein
MSLPRSPARSRPEARRRSRSSFALSTPSCTSPCPTARVSIFSACSASGAARSEHGMLSTALALERFRVVTRGLAAFPDRPKSDGNPDVSANTIAPSRGGE